MFYCCGPFFGTACIPQTVVKAGQSLGLRTKKLLCDTAFTCLAQLIKSTSCKERLTMTGLSLAASVFAVNQTEGTLTEGIIRDVNQCFSHLHLCKGHVIAPHVQETHRLRDQSVERAKIKI